MAQDNVEVMKHLGFDRFCVAGHDRGARAAFRMALDHPDKVEKFASFDILPTHHLLTHATWQWAVNSYHWFFMAQPYPIPERLIEGREDFYILKKLTAMGIGKGGFSQETLKEYLLPVGRAHGHAAAGARFMRPGDWKQSSIIFTARPGNAMTST